MQRELHPATYIMASRRNGTLYIGVTSNLIQRVWQHREGAVDGFTRKYGVKMLVWFEVHATMEHAIAREKALKKWNRTWKLALIESINPEWHDLWPEVTGAAGGKALGSRLRGNDDAEVTGTAGGKALGSRLRGNDDAREGS